MGVANDSHMALVELVCYYKPSKKTLVSWRTSSVNLPKLNTTMKRLGMLWQVTDRIVN